MPVGCLGETSTCGMGLGGNSHDGNSHYSNGSSHSNNCKDSSATELDVVITSSVLNAADQFAFMQQTLLLQIFRIPAHDVQGQNSRGRRAPSALSESTSSNSSSSYNGSNVSSNNLPSCPTCIAFADQCCQLENGIELFHDFVEINLQCYWDSRLTEALSNLR